MAASLTEDLVVEILSRLPTKSLRRFNCVSRRWRHLISYSDHRPKLPQTLAGFFYTSTNEERFPESARHFTHISGSRLPSFYPSFAFLPYHRRIELLDCCNGLLLCRWYDVSAHAQDDFRYVVCNPATEKWVALPDSSQAGKVGNARLGFDPAVSSHFHVFELLEEDHCDPYITGVEVYSSETGRWVHKEKGWNEDIRLANCQSATVFLNGRLHIHTYDYGLRTVGYGLRPCLAAVDTEGETWTNFRVPGGMDGGFIQLSQGRLHYANFQIDDFDVVRLVVYVLEDYDSQEWILKHSIETSYVFGGRRVDFAGDFDWIAMHPECNLIFFTAGWDITFMCYNIDTQQVRVIRDLVGDPPYLPYVPLYSELQALHM